MTNEKTTTMTDVMNSTLQFHKMDTKDFVMEDISDGFHTFGELYEHRITLFIALCRIFDDSQTEDNHTTDTPFPVWKSKRHSDGELAFGGDWFVLGIWYEKGKQITYHLPISKWDECEFAKELVTAPEFDGHTSDDVLKRLKEL